MNITLSNDEIGRFLSKFTPAPSGCMEWTGETNNQGYGRFTVYREGRRVRLLSHRVAFSLVRGLSDNKVVRHQCDNPPCANPDHLLTGTQADNLRDAIERGRRSIEPLAAYREQRDAAARGRLVTGRKTCSRCRTEKALDAFFRNRSHVDGRQYECKACALGVQHERRALKRRAAA